MIKHRILYPLAVVLLLAIAPIIVISANGNGRANGYNGNTSSEIIHIEQQITTQFDVLPVFVNISNAQDDASNTAAYTYEVIPDPATPPPITYYYRDITLAPDLYRVGFSHEAGFFDASFYLELTAPEGAEIFFTTDGSYPTPYSTRFVEPIFLYAPAPGRAAARFDAEIISQVQAVSVRAVFVLDGEISEITTRNFVMGTDVHERFCTNTLVFVLNSDPRNLFDHYHGILVGGIDRERFINNYYARNGTIPIPAHSSPANFNRRGIASEREAHLEMFDHTGALHISQRIGIRVKGGNSRSNPNQKSIELYAREIYGDRNNFAFAFFPDEFDANGRLVDRYGRVRLRNGGSDRYTGFIRDELSQALFRQAGHTTTQNHRPAAVFINGEYYGVAWLKTPRSESHLRRTFGGETERFSIVSGGEDLRNSSWGSEDRHAITDIRAVHQLAVGGFTGAAGQVRFEEFSSRICVESLVRYYAMQIFINNLDWPNHNFELWRYFPTEEEKNDPNLHPYLRDGRWRVFTHDLEASWSIWNDDNRRARDDTLRDILNRTNPARWNSARGSAFLTAMVNHDYTRAKLANTFSDLLYGAFTTENILYTLENLIAQIQPEHEYAMRANVISPQNRSWPRPDNFASSRDAIRRFAAYRPQVIRDSVTHNLGFDWGDRFTVSLTVDAGGTALMHSRPVAEGETATGHYFNSTQITITAQPRTGYTVNYWYVNGIAHWGNSITVSDDAVVVVRFRQG